MYLLLKLADIRCSILSMNLTDNETLKFLKGSPVFIEDICAVYSVTLGEIVDVGYDNFQQYLGILTTTKPMDLKGDNELKQLLEQINDFQYFLLMASIDSHVNSLVKSAFRFFTHSQVTLTLDPAQIVIGPLDEQHILDEKHFYDLQRLLRRMYFLEQEGEEIIIDNSDDPITKRIKMQLRASREKVRRAKAAKAAREKSDMKLSDLIGSMTLNDCGLNIINIWDMTYYAFHDQLKRMGWRDQFNINQKAALAGAKINKSELKHWMRSITSSDK